MIIDIVTLFPDMFKGFVSESILKRAINQNKVEINLINLRDYAQNKHKKVDDTPYGGGFGMVLMIEPVFHCLSQIKTKDSFVIMLTPQGKKYQQMLAYELSKKKHIILLCGHYEGFDERIRSLVDLEISIGDFVLTGGEAASMVVVDSIVRLLDLVISKESHLNDSFSNGLLEYPQYTKPQIFQELKVPEVLVNGNHQEIAKWRQKMSLYNTYNKRADLLNEYELNQEEMKWLEEFINESTQNK